MYWIEAPNGIRYEPAATPDRLRHRLASYPAGSAIVSGTTEYLRKFIPPTPAPHAASDAPARRRAA